MHRWGVPDDTKHRLVSAVKSMESKIVKMERKLFRMSSSDRMLQQL